MASTLYPTIHGFRVNPGVELSDGWNDRQLRDVMYALRANPDDDALLLESCTGREADLLLNPCAAMVLEAVTAQYNKLGRTMAALARVLGRHLPESLTLEGEPYIGPDRKNALFAYKVVTFNVSDGQTVSVLFHSPDNDPKKFQPDETLIAYRWMLNKLDITASVAPENGRDITLELMAKRMAQLIEANSAKFQEQSAAREERTAALADAEARREELRARTETAADEITALEDDLQSLAGRSSKTAERLEAERARNERLKAAKATKATQPEPVEPKPETQEQTPAHEAISAALKAGDLDAALKVVGSIRRASELANAVLRAGFGLAEMNSKKDIMDFIGGQMVQAARLKTDGFGLRALKDLGEGKPLIDMRRGFRIQKVGSTYSVSPAGSSDFGKYEGDEAEVIRLVNGGAPASEVEAAPSLETDLSTYRDLVKAGDADAAEELATQAPGRHGISYRDFIEKAGVSHETFATTPYADPRTRYAAALAEELAMAGFTPYDFPTGQPEFELGQYTAIASMQMAAGSGSVYVNEVAAGKATVEASYNPEMQPGLPVRASPRQTFTFDVPVGVLEGKFDDVVGEISGWLAGFGTAFDGVKLPEFGEKLKTDGVNQHDAADIAKRIRQDIKAMLPPGFKPSMFTVRSSKYSMGQSIKIGVKEVPEGFRLYESEAIEDQYGDKRYPMTRDAVALLKALKAIGNAYRYDNSDSQSDYFDTNFYFDAGYDDDLLRQQRGMAENAKAEAAKAANDAKIAEMQAIPKDQRTDTVYPLDGTSEFKAWLAGETETSIHGNAYDLDQAYSPLATAVAADKAAKSRGASIRWSMDVEGGSVGMIQKDGVIVARFELYGDGKAFAYYGATGEDRPKHQVIVGGETYEYDLPRAMAEDMEWAMGWILEEDLNKRARNKAIKKGAASQPEPVEPVQPEPAQPMTVEQARKALEDAQKRAREYRNTNNEGGYGFNPYDAEVEQAMQSLQDARNRELLADAEGYRARWNAAVQKYAKNGQLATGDLKKVEQEAGMTANEAKWLKEQVATQPQQPAPQPVTPEPSGNTPNPEEQTVNEVEAIAAELQKLADGAVTDTGEFDQMLDELADRAEKAGAMEELDGLLNAAADKLTELLEKEAASVA